MDIFECEICQQELDLTEQSFDMEGACEACAAVDGQFKCSCCGDCFSSEECGSCDDICQECDEYEE